MTRQPLFCYNDYAYSRSKALLFESMHSADDFDDLNDDDLLSAAVNCENGDDDDAFAISPRPNKRRRVSQNVSSVKSTPTNFRSNAKSASSGRVNRPMIATSNYSWNGSNGDALRDLTRDSRVTSTLKASIDGNNGKGPNNNRSGTSNCAKSTRRDGSAITT